MLSPFAVSLSLFFTGCASSQKACVASKAVAPYELIAVNSAWSELCGYPASDALGKTPKQLLHGEATDAVKSKEFTKRLQTKAPGSPCSVTLINYTKGGSPFAHLIASELVQDADGQKYFITESCKEPDAQVRRALFLKARLADPMWSGPAGLLIAFASAIMLILAMFCTTSYLPAPVAVEDDVATKLLKSLVEPAFGWTHGSSFMAF